MPSLRVFFETARCGACLGVVTEVARESRRQWKHDCLCGWEEAGAGVSGGVMRRVCRRSRRVLTAAQFHFLVSRVCDVGVSETSRLSETVGVLDDRCGWGPSTTQTQQRRTGHMAGLWWCPPPSSSASAGCPDAALDGAQCQRLVCGHQRHTARGAANKCRFETISGRLWGIVADADARKRRACVLRALQGERYQTPRPSSTRTTFRL